MRPWSNPFANPLIAPLLLLFAALCLPSRAMPLPGKDICSSIIFEGARFFVCKLEAAHHEAALVLNGRNGKPLRNFAALKAFRAGSTPVLAMNAGMYDTSGRPIGLYIENRSVLQPLNTREATGNYYLKPNGVYARWKDGSMSVESSERFAARRERPVFATQSGPMLVINGKLHPKFTVDGDSRFIRNGVGVSDPRTAWLVISEDRVSFGKFARLFRDRLSCRDALFLDGIVSSIWHPASKRMDSLWASGPMLVVTKRKP